MTVIITRKLLVLLTTVNVNIGDNNKNYTFRFKLFFFYYCAINFVNNPRKKKNQKEVASLRKLMKFVRVTYSFEIINCKFYHFNANIIQNIIIRT